MVSPRKLWQSFTGNVRRQTAAIPAVCYDECNLAAQYIQSVGENSVICSSGSPFTDAVQLCDECLTLHENETDSISISNIEEILHYCNGSSDASNSQSIQTLLAQESALIASQSGLEESLSSLGYNSNNSTATATSSNETSITQPPTTTTNQSAGIVTVYETAASSNSHGQSRVRTIVPAVVVPVVVVIIVAIMITIIFIRRRRAKKVQTQTANPSGNYEGKAQLHSDDFRPELDGTAVAAHDPTKKKAVDREEIAELPARELVGSEMDAKGQLTGP